MHFADLSIYTREKCSRGIGGGIYREGVPYDSRYNRI